MENLTLVIPAKEEKESLPVVLKELQDFKLKKLIICFSVNSNIFFLLVKNWSYQISVNLTVWVIFNFGYHPNFFFMY